MLFALSAASALLDGLQSLSTSSPSSSASASGTPFDLTAGMDDASSGSTSAATSFGAQMSPQTLGALLDAQGQSDASGSSKASGSAAGSDPLMQMLDASTSSSVTNSDGSTTTITTHADGSTSTTVSPAAQTSSKSGSSVSSAATSAYNQINQLIQQQAQALSMQVGSTLSLAA